MVDYLPKGLESILLSTFDRIAVYTRDNCPLIPQDGIIHMADTPYDVTLSMREWDTTVFS